MPTKSSADTEAVRTRAYLMWEADGRPDGAADHYWSLAAAELTPGPAARPKRAAAGAAAAVTTAKPAKAAKPKAAKATKASPKPVKSKKKT